MHHLQKTREIELLKTGVRIRIIYMYAIRIFTCLIQRYSSYLITVIWGSSGSVGNFENFENLRHKGDQKLKTIKQNLLHPFYAFKKGLDKFDIFKVNS